MANQRTTVATYSCVLISRTLPLKFPRVKLVLERIPDCRYIGSRLGGRLKAFIIGDRARETLRVAQQLQPGWREVEQPAISRRFFGTSTRDYTFCNEPQNATHPPEESFNAPVLHAYALTRLEIPQRTSTATGFADLNASTLAAC